MGLDMHAHRRIYVENWDFTPKEDHYQVSVTRDGKAVAGIKPEDITYVEVGLMDWRKANHIHKWFVDNVQDGQDNCGTYCVSDEKLRQLLSVCEEVIKASKLIAGTVRAKTVLSRDYSDGEMHGTPARVIADATVAQKLLPTRDGFFFGSTEYDEFYLKDVVDTRDWLKRVLDDQANGVEGDIRYSSSW